MKSKHKQKSAPQDVSHEARMQMTEMLRKERNSGNPFVH